MQIVTKQFDSFVVSFTNDAYFNATEAASKYGKKVGEWLRLPSTTEYIEAVTRYHKPDESVKVGFSHFDNQPESVVSDLVVTLRGGTSPGTWLHPALVVAFARWLDINFAVWCDRQIHLLMSDRTEEALRNVEALKEQLAQAETERLEDQVNHALELRKADDAAERTALRVANLKTKTSISPLWSMDTIRLEKRAIELEGQKRFLSLKLDTAEQILNEVAPTASPKVKRMLDRRSDIIRTLEKGGVVFSTKLTE